MVAAVVPGVDAAPALDFAEHVFDLVALAIEGPIVRDLHLSVGLCWDARGDPAIGQSGAEPVGIVAFGTEQCQCLSPSYS